MAKNRIVFSDDFILKNQKIGIGTSDPKESLDVVGNATISQNLYVGNSIGIGTTSPKSDFDVNGTLSVSGVSTFSNDVNILSSINGNPIGKFNDGGNVELYNNGSKKFETTGIGVSVYNGSSDTATIEGPGNLIIDPMPVGVGTTSGVVRIRGDLYVDGTETIINSTTIELADFIVGIASTATTDMLADGAGIKIGPDNTFLYEYNGGTNPSLKSSENLNVESGKVYQIDQTEVLSSTTLGSGVTQSSLTGVGILTALSVSGDVSVTDKIVHTGDTDTAIRFPSDNTFTIETNGQERLRVTGIATQSVGIGTTDPTALLDIAGSIRIRGVFYDELNHPGGANQVLSATGTGVTWTGFSDISVGDASTLDNLDSTQFLRSDENDTKSGITTFQALVDIDANLDIRDTLTVGQGVTVTGISTFNSNVDIDANVDIRDTLTVGQGVTITGISTFNSNVDVDANVDIRDTLTVGQGVTVTGISTFNSNVDIRDNLIVSGVSTISIADTTSYDPANGPVSPTGSDVLTLINTDQTTDGYTGIYFQHKTNNVAWGRMALQGNFFGSPQHAFVFTMRGGSGLSNNEKFRIGNTGTISFKGDTDTYITGDGSDSIQIYTNSLERVGIDSLGKVGIGTDSPTQLLDVNGDLRLRGGLYDSGINTTGTSAQSLVSTGDGVSWKDSNTIASGQEIFAPASGTPYYITATNVTSGIASAAFNDSTIVIKDSNVGIGTTIPTQTLDVNGTATVRDSLSIGTTTPTAKLTIDVGTGTTAIDVQGSAGQLFSVTNNLTSGSIFSVNDVSGIPSIDVDADGTIQLAPFGSTENVGIGTTNPSQKLDVNGGIRLRGALYDFGGNAGGINQSLVSTGTGVTWSTMTLAAAGQQIYEEEASTAYYLVGTKITPSLTGIGTAGFASDTVVLKDSKIGIGSDSPAEKLDVGGNIKILSNGNGASASSYELLFYGT